MPQYYVENNHEVIIDLGTFEMVQTELARRTDSNKRLSGIYILSHKFWCVEYGGWYGNKPWHSSDKYRRMVWQCNRSTGTGTKSALPRFW